MTVCFVILRIFVFYFLLFVLLHQNYLCKPTVDSWVFRETQHNVDVLDMESPCSPFSIDSNETHQPYYSDTMHTFESIPQPCDYQTMTRYQGPYVHYGIPIDVLLQQAETQRGSFIARKAAPPFNPTVAFPQQPVQKKCLH